MSCISRSIRLKHYTESVHDFIALALYKDSKQILGSVPPVSLLFDIAIARADQIYNPKKRSRCPPNILPLVESARLAQLYGCKVPLCAPPNVLLQLVNRLSPCESETPDW